MTRYSQHYNVRRTAQTQPIPGREEDMVPNAAGGFAFGLDKWAQLRRFIILGAEGGTYYTTEQKLSRKNASNVVACIKEDGARVVDYIVEVSQSGRAPKNDPAIFVLALCASLGNAKTRKAALGALPKVARIGTHLFKFLQDIKRLRGWGRGLRTAIAKWYNDKSPERLAYQVAKYQQRVGWSHRDALRLAHPKAQDEAHNAIYRWIVKGGHIDFEVSELLSAVYLAKEATSPAQIVKLIRAAGLTREMIPTQFLNDPNVWRALLENMPLMAMIRNLGKMTSIGLVAPASVGSRLVISKLQDSERIRKARVHPMSLLLALKTYTQGHGFRGKLSWNPVGLVIDAIDGAFYAAFDNVQPTGKTRVIGIDASGSMSSPFSGTPLSCRYAAVALGLITAATEQDYVILGFTSRGKVWPIEITPRQRLPDAWRTFDRRIIAEGTDGSLPILWAIENNFKADAFELYTDNETWAGRRHPMQAFDEYRRKFNSEAKMVVVGMTPTGYSIADPKDKAVLNVVGFDTAVPPLIASFVAGDV